MNRPSFKNIGWTIERLHMLIVEENPCISYQEGLKKAKETLQELNRLNKNMFDNTKKYFSNNLPFSYFEDDENFLEFFDIEK